MLDDKDFRLDLGKFELDELRSMWLTLWDAMLTLGYSPNEPESMFTNPPLRALHAEVERVRSEVRLRELLGVQAGVDELSDIAIGDTGGLVSDGADLVDGWPGDWTIDQEMPPNAP